MKQTLITLSCLSLLMSGCVSSSPTQWARNMFGSKDTNHTFAQSESKSGKTASPSATAMSDETFRKGEAALQSGNWKQARKHFMEVVQTDPENAAAHHRLGYIADKLEDYGNSEIHYLTAMRIEPKNPDISCDLGYSYMLQGRNKDARRYLERSIQVYPQHQASLLNLGTLAAQEGDYNGASALFRQAGTEEEAQANLARFFPKGPPTGEKPAAIAKKDETPSETMRDLQDRMAKAQNRPSGAPQAPHPGMQHRKPSPKTAAELALAQPREVPLDRINDVFAQIDAEFEEQRLQQQSRPAYPMNSMPAPPIATHQPNQSYPSMPGSQQQYMTQNNSSVPTQTPWQENVQPAIPQQVPGYTDPSLQDPVVLHLDPHQQSTSVPQNLPTRNPSQINLAGGTNHPGNVSIGTDRYQQAMQKAMQLGMNAGPGQMFPITASQQSGPRVPTTPITGHPYPGHQRLNLPEPNQTVPAAPQQGAPWNSPQMIIPMQGQSNDTSIPPQTGIQQGIYESSQPDQNGYGNTYPTGAEVGPPQWPYAGQNSPGGQSAPQAPAQPDPSTPWLNQNPAPTPAPSMQIEARPQSPPQWPYAPQAGSNPNYNTPQNPPAMSVPPQAPVRNNSLPLINPNAG